MWFVGRRTAAYGLIRKMNGKKFEDTLEKMPMSRDVNRFQRTLQNTVSDSAIDKQGRISLTPLQMKIAGINKM